MTFVVIRGGFKALLTSLDFTGTAVLSTYGSLSPNVVPRFIDSTDIKVDDDMIQNIISLRAKLKLAIR